MTLRPILGSFVETPAAITSGWPAHGRSPMAGHIANAMAGRWPSVGDLGPVDGRLARCRSGESGPFVSDRSQPLRRHPVVGPSATDRGTAAPTANRFRDGIWRIRGGSAEVAELEIGSGAATYPATSISGSWSGVSPKGSGGSTSTRRPETAQIGGSEGVPRFALPPLARSSPRRQESDGTRRYVSAGSHRAWRAHRQPDRDLPSCCGAATQGSGQTDGRPMTGHATGHRGGRPAGRGRT